MDQDPFRQFDSWLTEARESLYGDPYAMTLATIGPDGAPAARTVSLKDVDDRGFIFTSHYESPKARDIERDPRVALVFYWPELGRQVRIRGAANKLPEEASVRYFDARTREQQLALLVSGQSSSIGSVQLDGSLANLATAYEGREIPRPQWGGYVVRPTTIEFWQGQANRLHDRFQYQLTKNGTWTIRRLSP